MMDRPNSSASSDKEICARFSKAYSLLEKDGHDPEAIGLLRENVIGNCSSSAVLLGYVYSQGSDEERRESVKLFRKAAALGNSSGMRNLGYCYAVGINTEKDKAEGARWYRMAAEAGNARAMCNLGVMYDFGNGVEKDPEQAFKWFLMSAENGYARGMTNLGELYMQGRGTGKDIAEAEKWFVRSGSPRATFHLAEIYAEMKDDPDMGMKYLRMSADMGYSKALVRYGLLTEDENPESAREMFLKAAAKGNTAAIELLEERGIPVPESRRKKKSK